MSMLPGLAARVERYEQRLQALNEGMKTLERIGSKTLDEHRTKYCSRCDHTKPLVEFAKCSASKDGHQWWCRACYSTYLADRRTQKRARAKQADSQILFDQQDDTAPIKGMVLGVMLGLPIWLIIIALVLAVIS